MKRRVVASLSVLLALAGRGLPQTPPKLPDAVTDPVPVKPGRAAVNVPARAAVAKPEQTQPPGGGGPAEKLPAAKESAPSSAPASTTPSQNAASGARAAAQPQQPEKPSLAVMHHGPCDTIWVRGGYLNWWVKDTPLPGIIAFTPQETIGNGVVDYGAVGGFRISAGTWLDCQHITGIEGGGFLLNEQSRTFSLNSPGNPPILRPFTDPVNAIPGNFVVASPAVAVPGAALTGIAGSLTTSTSLRLGGAEMSLVRNVLHNDCYTLNALMGFRYLLLEENLDVTSRSTSPNADLFFNGVPNASTVTVSDSFHTRNQMWGGQFGLRFEARRDIWFAELSAKVALGPNKQTVDTAGFTTGTVNGLNQTVDGGFLSVGPNSGRDSTRWFSVAPEVGLTVGMQVTRSIRAHLGYDFLYVNNVVRPADLYSTTINQRFVPASAFFNTQSGPAVPAFRTSRDDFYAHGVEAGLQFSY